MHNDSAKFTSGSTMRHVVVMSITSAAGALAVFLVDALSLFYISMLKIEEFTAAVGFASAVQFFATSLSIGLSVATTAMVSQALGRGSRKEAAEAGGVSMALSVLPAILITILTLLKLDYILALLGASGNTSRFAEDFLTITLASTPITVLGMCATGIIRAAGDVRRATKAKIWSCLIAAVVDPLMIFGMNCGLEGAAIATVISRAALLLFAAHGAIRVHKLVALPSFEMSVRLLRQFLGVSVPASVAHLATPISSAYMTHTMARFGDGAVAGWAIIGRLIPIAFGALFAIGGAVSPIVGQNYGAQRRDRIRSTVRSALSLSASYVALVWLIIALCAEQLSAFFSAEGTARELVIFYCRFVAVFFFFNGALFITTAAFSSMKRAGMAMLFSWLASTVGVIVPVTLGAQRYDAEGAILGWAVGSALSGIAALYALQRLIKGENPSADAQDSWGDQ